MIEAVRLLAFAFAGADLLFEIDRAGTILFATGAPSTFSKDPELTGRAAADLFIPSERARFNIVARGLSPGERAGPLPMTLVSGEKAMLSMCLLPQVDRISCTLVKPGNRSNFSDHGTDRATGLADKNAFLAATTKGAGSAGMISLVNLPELADVCAKLPPKDAASLLAAIGVHVKQADTLLAARLSETRFGVLGTDPLRVQGLAARILEAVRERGLQSVEAEEVLLSLKGRNLSPEQNIFALRHVISRFAEGTLAIKPGADLADIFESLLNETLARAQSFSTTVAEGNFELVFEPVVDLSTGRTSHYEALTRFEPDQSPAETIRFAEELGLADWLDLAVAVKAFEMLEKDAAILASIAINMSGPSLIAPTSFAVLHALFFRKRVFAKRVRIEITETAEITDLPAADRAIQSLRQMGYRVGIDDFGAGAASLHYLHGLNVDFVKVDGGLIQRLGKTPRDDALVRGVLASCAALNVESVAEWIDNQERLKLCVEAGFQFGQGRHFGDPLKKLPHDPSFAPAHGPRIAPR